MECLLEGWKQSNEHEAMEAGKKYFVNTEKFFFRCFWGQNAMPIQLISSRASFGFPRGKKLPLSSPPPAFSLFRFINEIYHLHIILREYDEKRQHEVDALKRRLRLTPLPSPGSDKTD